MYALSVPFALSLFVTQVLRWSAWKTVMSSLSSCLPLLMLQRHFFDGDYVTHCSYIAFRPSRLYLRIKFKVYNNFLSLILSSPLSRSLLPSCLTSIHSLFSSDVTFLTYFQFHKYIMNTLLSHPHFLSLSSLCI